MAPNIEFLEIPITAMVLKLFSGSIILLQINIQSIKKLILEFLNFHATSTQFGHFAPFVLGGIVQLYSELWFDP